MKLDIILPQKALLEKLVPGRIFRPGIFDMSTGLETGTGWIGWIGCRAGVSRSETTTMTTAPTRAAEATTKTSKTASARVGCIL